MSSWPVVFPDSRQLRTKSPVPKLAGNSLARLGSQADIILDIPDFLFLEASEDFHNSGLAIHYKYYLIPSGERKGRLPPD